MSSDGIPHLLNLTKKKDTKNYTKYMANGAEMNTLYLGGPGGPDALTYVLLTPELAKQMNVEMK